jgi:NitT/TauT family transport system substrate-binding protein
MPEMTFEYALKINKIDPKKDLNIDTSIAFAAMEGAFVGGLGDFVTLFEPNATNIEKEKLGYVVASVGELAGTVPYTSFNAKKSFINNNPETIKKFNNALQKGLDFIHNNDSKVVAEEIINQFPDSNINDLSNIITRYKDIDAWYKTTYINKDDFLHIFDIINDNTLKKDFDKLVNNEFSQK